MTTITTMIIIGIMIVSPMFADGQLTGNRDNRFDVGCKYPPFLHVSGEFSKKNPFFVYIQTDTPSR